VAHACIQHEWWRSAQRAPLWREPLPKETDQPEQKADRESQEGKNVVDHGLILKRSNDFAEGAPASAFPIGSRTREPRLAERCELKFFRIGCGLKLPLSWQLACNRSDRLEGGSGLDAPETLETKQDA
jgi:hypothetical protein